MTRRSGPGSDGGLAVGLAPGSAEGTALVLVEPLSFWGGIDPRIGVVIERRHPDAGARIQGRVLVMPSGRGSSSSSTVLAEAVRVGSAPAGIVLKEPDTILALGSLVAAELYRARVPVVVAPASIYDAITSGDVVAVEAPGAPGDAARITIKRRASRPPPGR